MLCFQINPSCHKFVLTIAIFWTVLDTAWPKETAAADAAEYMTALRLPVFSVHSLSNNDTVVEVK